jgi:hypothetical protein
MEFDYIAFILVFLYFLLFIFELKQFISIFYLKNRKINYRNGIILTLLFSSLLRIVFWIKVMINTTVISTFMMILFYFPIFLNFTGISLLCVFYANTIYSNSWFATWPKYICAILNLIFLFLNIAIGCLVESASTNQQSHVVIYDCYIYYAVFIDFFIALLVGYYGYNFVYDSQYHTYRTHILLPRSIRTFAVINWIIVICFLIRSLFVFLFSLPIIKQSTSTEIEFNGNHPVTSYIMLIFFFITEWIPNIAMLYLLWKPNTKKPKKFRSENYVSSNAIKNQPSDEERPSETSFKEDSFSFKFITGNSHNNSSQGDSSSHSLSGLLPFPIFNSIFGGEKSASATSSTGASTRRYQTKKYRGLNDEDETDSGAGESILHDNLLTENDLRDSGINVRNTSVEDSKVRIYYNRSVSENSAPPYDFSPQHPQSSSDERISDYGQHSMLLPEEMYDYAHEFQSESLPILPSLMNYPPSLMNPANTGVGGGVKGNRKHLGSYDSHFGDNSNNPSPATSDNNRLSSSIISPAGNYGRKGQNSARNSLNIPSNRSHDNLSGFRSRETSSHKLSSTTNTVISSLYLHPTPQIIGGKTPTSAHLTELDLNQRKFSSFSSNTGGTTGPSSMGSTGGGIHLDPSAIFKPADPNHSQNEGFRQYDLNQKYADTIGPRDILNSKL